MVMLRVADRAVGVISFAILARLLLPEHFGLVALAGSLGAFLELLSDFSVELALIREPGSERRLYDGAWTIKILRSLAVSVLLVLLAPAVARFFEEPRVEAVIYVLAAAGLILSFENIGVVEFRKHLAFEMEFLYLLASRSLATVTTVLSALIWRNYWVLIAGILVHKTAQVALSYALHDYRPRLSFEGIPHLFQFSKWMIVQNILHGLNQRMPGWVIARLAGVGTLAFYEVAAEIATLTTTELRAPIRRALYPGFAKMADDRKALHQAFCDAYALMAVIGLPLPVGLVLTAPLLVQVFLGAQWISAVPVIEVLGFYGLVQALGSSSHVVYLAVNRPSITARLAGLQSLILLPLLVTGATAAGARGAAWALTITAVVILFADFFVVFRVLGIGPQRIFTALARPITGIAAMLAGLIPLRLLVPTPESWIGSALCLGAFVVTGGVLYVGTVSALWYWSGRPEGAERHILSALKEGWRRWASTFDESTRTQPQGATVPSVIVFGLNEWSDNWQTRQYIGAELAQRGWSVLYTTGAGDWWERGTAAWRARTWFGRTEQRDHVQIYRQGKLDARWRRVTAADRWMLRRHATKLMARAKWPATGRRIAYVFHPSFWPYLEYLDDDCTVVYHADDAFSLMPGWDEHCQDMEAKLVARADVLLATSPGIARLLPGEAWSRTRYLPNGAPVDSIHDLAQGACPHDLSLIPSPRIGYIGSVNMKVDLLLVAEIARRRPDWHWAIIGPVMAHQFDGFPGNADFQAGLSACRELTNVHFLGAKPHYVLPSYTAHMDVNAMCYRNVPGGWWTAIYPLKLHEYLAVGKPVVGTNLEVLREFRTVVAVAETADDWVQAISAAINAGGTGTMQERQAVARQNSWESRVDSLVHWLEDAPPSKTKELTRQSQLGGEASWAACAPSPPPKI